MGLKIPSDKTPPFIQPTPKPRHSKHEQHPLLVRTTIIPAKWIDQQVGTERNEVALNSLPISSVRKKESRQHPSLPFVLCLLSRNHTVIIIIEPFGSTRSANFPHDRSKSKIELQLQQQQHSTTNRFTEHQPENIFRTRTIPTRQANKSEHPMITPENYQVTNRPWKRTPLRIVITATSY